MFTNFQPRIQQSQQALLNARHWLRLADHMVMAEKTPYEVIWQSDITKVRHYLPLDSPTIMLDDKQIPVEPKQYSIPIVIVAPLAVNMYIYDLFPFRSLIRFLLAKGFDVYLVDWGKPSRRHNRHHLHTYYGKLLPECLNQVRRHSGSEKLSLHGWSLGGLFSYCYTALHQDETIENLILVGAPCDYHVNGSLGKQYQRLGKGLGWLESGMGWRVHRTPRRLWRVRGWQNAVGFKLTNPVGSVQGYLKLIRNLHDRDYVANHATNAAFLDRMEGYPGGVVQDIVHYLWGQNVLAKGALPQRDNSATLRTIKSNIFAVTGRDDPIVMEKCFTSLLDNVSSTDIQHISVPGGHMGILGGNRAHVDSWQPIVDWLSSRSGNQR